MSGPPIPEPPHLTHRLKSGGTQALAEQLSLHREAPSCVLRFAGPQHPLTTASWSWVGGAGAPPGGGLIAAAGEMRRGERWWFVFTEGLYYSPDGGKHLSRVLDASGKQ